MLNEEKAADARAVTVSNSVPQASNGTNGRKIIYTTEEQAHADRLKVLMYSSDKSAADEGEEWYAVRELLKEKGERFKSFYESVGADHERVYNCLKALKKRRVKSAADAIPPSIEQEATKAGIELENPAQREAVARAIVDEKISAAPTYRQVLSVVNNALETIDEVAETGKENPESEEEEILAALNGVFTGSYKRVVGDPKFQKDRKTKERRFVGYAQPDGVFVKVEAGGWTPEETAWMKATEATLRSITGMTGMQMWLAGGPDLGQLGRGFDSLTFADINQETAA